MAKSTSKYAPSLLRMPQVCERTGLARSTIYDFMADGTFPRPVPLTPTRRAWREDEISEWIQSRINTSKVAPTTLTAPTAAPASKGIDNGDGTVTDPRTGLMWTKETLPGGRMTYDEVVKACKVLRVAEHKDWRPPTVEELFALADRSRHSPAIDTDLFPDTKSDWYWTSTLCAWAPSCAWIVSFSYCGVYYPHRNGYAFVRAVRAM